MNPRVDPYSKFDLASKWFYSLPQQQGLAIVSPDQAYFHQEGQYDEQYQNSALDLSRADPLIQFFDQYHINSPFSVVLDLACGPGTLTLGLASCYPNAFVIGADASSSFLKISQQKASQIHPNNSSNLHWLRLNDQDLCQLPKGLFDLVTIRSGLHHFVDWRMCMKDLSRLLSVNGILAMFEPKADFFIYTELLLSDLSAHHYDSLPQEAIDFINLFSATASFYIQQDVDKAQAEDKHAFFVEDLVNCAYQCNLRLVSAGHEYSAPFSKSCRDYLQYCMSAPQSILVAYDAYLGKQLDILDRYFGSRQSNYGPAEWFLLTPDSTV
jgi:ubiquinone/menaquinone biosynthesis C-methylase UbiE